MLVGIWPPTRVDGTDAIVCLIGSLQNKLQENMDRLRLSGTIVATG